VLVGIVPAKVEQSASSAQVVVVGIENRRFPSPPNITGQFVGVPDVDRECPRQNDSQPLGLGRHIDVEEPNLFHESTNTGWGRSGRVSRWSNAGDCRGLNSLGRPVSRPVRGHGDDPSRPSAAIAAST